MRRSQRYWAGLSTDLVIEQVLMRTLKSRGGLTHGRGLTESVRTSWVSCMHKSASIYDSLLHFLKLNDNDKEHEHKDLSSSRLKRDHSDICKLMDFFTIRNPFDICNSKLRSIYTGLSASEEDNVTCDIAEDVGCLNCDNGRYG